MMEQAIKNFARQFAFEPSVENGRSLKPSRRFLVVGMGGSHLAADIIKTYDPKIDLYIHRDYGVPKFSPDVLNESLIICSSYSGNTEEVISAFSEAVSKKLNLAAISVGGRLIELAQQDSVPFVKMPDTGIQPRSALGFSLRGLLKLMGQDEALAQTSRLAATLDPLSFKQRGEALARRIFGKVPVVYSSQRNFSVAYNWKIKFNETGKIPAFYNVFPELNHNEMSGFDLKEATRPLASRFHFIFLKDASDHPRLQNRMQVLEGQLKQRGLGVESLELKGDDVFYKIFSSLVLADWTALATAEKYGLDPERVPMIEEFKKLIR